MPTSYPIYARWAHANLRPGGLLIGDNAYLFGDLLEDSERGHAMREFHTFCAANFDSVCIPTPDGLVVARR
jgi:predicted O-methyltransferase YrrM